MSRNHRRLLLLFPLAGLFLPLLFLGVRWALASMGAESVAIHLAKIQLLLCPPTAFIGSGQDKAHSVAEV